MTGPTGVLELYLGRTKGPTQLEMATDAVVHSPTGAKVTGGHRLFGIVESALLYAQEMAADGHALFPHMSARLLRVGG